MDESKFVLKHTNGDFEVTVEFKAESLSDVIMCIKDFLKACTFSSSAVDEYFPED